LSRPAIRRRLALAFFALAALSGAASAQGIPPAAPAPFDYYAMTLSWSPGFCALGGEDKSPQQCAPGSGDGFVVHGLWPNNRRGANPEDCGGGNVSEPELANARGLYPTAGLARYEYRKHGSCTGLSARDYFATVRYVRDNIAIPPMLKSPGERQRLAPRALQQAFMDANANLKPTNMAITCVRGQLADVRFCLTPNLRAFAICREVSGRTCRSDSIWVAPVR
jgi:ribonuclease T2